MGCCGSDMASDAVTAQMSDTAKTDELRAFGKVLADGKQLFVFSSPSIRCGSCIAILESELSKLENVTDVRVNLTLKRVKVTLADEEASPLGIFNRMESLGYDTVPLDITDGEKSTDVNANGRLLRALAVAGFGAMNIMLLSVSTWSGAEGSAKTLFHLISAVIAIPTVLYSGQIFFQSAYKVLRHGRLNMDVPISLAVSLALIMSVYEALTHGDVVYFDASVSLLFFLLIGRYLDHMMREKARNTINTLARRNVRGATQVTSDGQTSYLPIDEIKPDMVLQVLPGEKLPVDGQVIKGSTDIDLSLVNGESLPSPVTIGDDVMAGTLNLSGVIQLKVTKTADQSFLAEVTRMLDAAENGRGTYVRIADRMARIYAPAVHLLSFIGFVVWMFATGGDWHTSIYIAIAILIITCPCALGLAVPVVHVIGAGRLFEHGILMRDGSALERLSEIDYAVFDKTGTLTSDRLSVFDVDLKHQDDAALVKALGKHSSHPASRAMVQYFKAEPDISIEGVREVPGFGLEGVFEGKRVRLGSYKWISEVTNFDEQVSGAGIFFAREGQLPSKFSLHMEMRPDAKITLSELKSRSFPIEILSGDHQDAVANVANNLGVDNYTAQAKPADKIARINALKTEGKHVLMVGDGINDAPSLAAGHASMAPASASDVGRSAADFVFTRNNLSSILFALDTAKKSDRLIKQNFALALAYNAVAVPLAFAGFVTPLFAAIAMSASSIVVILNSMRLATARPKGEKNSPATSAVEALS
jgi:Cu2+-exporting ATPase